MAVKELPKIYPRKFPRRLIRGPVGVLCQGKYVVGNALEIGEGGMKVSFHSLPLEVGRNVTMSFFVPSKDFVVATGVIVYSGQKNAAGDCAMGVKFSSISFERRRAIRDYITHTKEKDVV